MQLDVDYFSLYSFIVFVHPLLVIASMLLHYSSPFLTDNFSRFPSLKAFFNVCRSVEYSSRRPRFFLLHTYNNFFLCGIRFFLKPSEYIILPVL